MATPVTFLKVIFEFMQNILKYETKTIFLSLNKKAFFFPHNNVLDTCYEDNTFCDTFFDEADNSEKFLIIIISDWKASMVESAFPIMHRQLLISLFWWRKFLTRTIQNSSKGGMGTIVCKVGEVLSG